MGAHPNSVKGLKFCNTYKMCTNNIQKHPGQYKQLLQTNFTMQTFTEARI